MVQNRHFRTSARGERALKTFVNACKTWFWRLGSRTLRQAPPKAPKSASRHTFFSKKCVQMLKNHHFRTSARGERTLKTFVNACKTWFWRLGSRTLRQAPSKTPKSASRHTFAQKKCVQMVQNHDSRTLERAARGPKTFKFAL